VFASAFYEALAAGRPVDLALAAARREVNLGGEEGQIEWATPVLYMRGDGELFSFEEREPVQPQPTSVAPRTATPAPGTGAAATAEHDREPKVEPAKTQAEEAVKKPPLDSPKPLLPPMTPLPFLKIAGPTIILLGGLVFTTAFSNNAFLLANPLVLIGLALLFLLGVLWALIRLPTEILPAVDRKTSGVIVQSLLRYGFWIAALLIVLGIVYRTAHST
ncbi:MAG: hypothetical protein ACREVJ_10130, partial [Gammaproteobacteria bacterium]